MRACGSASPIASGCPNSTVCAPICPHLEAVVDVERNSTRSWRRGWDYAPNLPRRDDLAVIAYTSGTTGRSKGAMLLHRNLIANITSLREAWHWTADDHLLLALPLFHAHGLMVGAHGTLTAGATMTLHRRFDAATRSIARSAPSR